MKSRPGSDAAFVGETCRSFYAGKDGPQFHVRLEIAFVFWEAFRVAKHLLREKLHTSTCCVCLRVFPLRRFVDLEGSTSERFSRDTHP